MFMQGSSNAVFFSFLSSVPIFTPLKSYFAALAALSIVLSYNALPSLSPSFQTTTLPIPSAPIWSPLSLTHFPLSRGYSTFALFSRVCTVVQNCQESGCKYWAICLSVRSHRSLIRLPSTARFTRMLHCVHSFIRSLTYSLPSLWKSEWLDVSKRPGFVPEWCACSA